MSEFNALKLYSNLFNKSLMIDNYQKIIILDEIFDLEKIKLSL